MQALLAYGTSSSSDEDSCDSFSFKMKEELDTTEPPSKLILPTPLDGHKLETSELDTTEPRPNLIFPTPLDGDKLETSELDTTEPPPKLILPTPLDGDKLQKSELDTTEPPPKLILPTPLDGHKLQTSVFVNPYMEAELAKAAILERHVKMVPGNKEMVNGMTICWSYRKGRCRFGHKCKYAHDSDVQRTPEQLIEDQKRLAAEKLAEKLAAAAAALKEAATKEAMTKEAATKGAAASETVASETAASGAPASGESESGATASVAPPLTAMAYGTLPFDGRRRLLRCPSDSSDWRSSTAMALGSPLSANGLLRRSATMALRMPAPQTRRRRPAPTTAAEASSSAAAKRRYLDSDQWEQKKCKPIPPRDKNGRWPKSFLKLIRPPYFGEPWLKKFDSTGAIVEADDANARWPTRPSVAPRSMPRDNDDGNGWEGPRKQKRKRPGLCQTLQDTPGSQAEKVEECCSQPK